MILDLNSLPLEDVQNDESAPQQVGGQTHEDQVVDNHQLQRHRVLAELPFDLNIAQDEVIFDMTDSDEDIDIYVGHNEVVFEEEVLNSTSDEEAHDPGDDQNHFANNSQQQNMISRKNLTNKERWEVYAALLALSDNGNIKKDSTSIVATRFNINTSYVRSIWRLAKKCIATGIPVDVSSQRSKNCGRTKVNIPFAQVGSIELNKRSTIRSLAEALNVKKSTLHNAFKAGKLRRHSNTLKPYLKDSNKKHRLQFSLSMLNVSNQQNEFWFNDMRNIVHIDEKWFNTTKKSKKFYMLPNEDDPLRTVQNTQSINKVMLLGAVARPRYDTQGTCYFDGKIGIWPFVRKEPAARSSCNRPRGTLITKAMNVTREVSRAYLITKVIPAIVARWPAEDAGKTIWIQQDNARTHVPPNDEAFVLAVQQCGRDIRLMNQPPNSPDMNVLDLGFFASLQSMTYLKNSKTMDELIHNVQQEYNRYDPRFLNRVFLTLQSCFIEVMKAGGGNGYKIPHMNKEGLELGGMLPNSLMCDRDLYDHVMELLGH